MLYQYWYFKAVSYKLEPHVCNCCHDILMMAHELKHLPILNVNSVDYRCILQGISKNEAVNILNNYALEVKYTL